MRGPLAYRNWRAALANPQSDPSEGAEYLLFGDAPATGPDWVLGPYELFNTLSGSYRPDATVGPPIALRAWYHLRHAEWLPPLTKTNISGYTGTSLPDEIAALLALLTGRRLRAGGAVRRFNSKHDPGSPIADSGIEKASVPPVDRRMLPRQATSFELHEEKRTLLGSYPSLPAAHAVALARAARTYRDGLWMAETEPELGWLLLISAIECATNIRKHDESDQLQQLTTQLPKLIAVMASGQVSMTIQRAIANELSHLLGSTNKFVTFLDEFGPRDGPSPRPVHARLPWHDRDAMTKAYRIIYGHRSKTLHEAVGFPVPMLSVPRRWEVGAGYDEVPTGLASGARGGAWTREHTPMLLHTFEYIVQHSLLAWWRTLAPAA